MPKHKYPRHNRPIWKQLLTLLILAGIALLLIDVFAFKSCVASAISVTSLEAQSDQELEDGCSVFVFLHSLDCIPCKGIMSIVANLYSDFRDAIVLIDVDAYDPVNLNLLRSERLQSIPTLVFYNTQERRQVFIGVIPPDPLCDMMTQLMSG